jgi:hypothetical protein
MIGYKFTTKEDAAKAVELCDVYYHIPAEPDDVTTHWCMYNEAVFNEPIFWFIIYDESLVPVLGEPTEFDVNEPIIKDATN